MTTLIVLGTALVAITWLVIALLLPWTGRWAPALIDSAAESDYQWRTSVWWGLALVTVAIVAVGLAQPLGGGLAAVVILVILVTAAGIGLILRRPAPPTWRGVGASTKVFLTILSTAVVYLAIKALGPVTNYDSGLYHLGAVKYAQDFGTIPGLATLFFPFGYASPQFPLAAFLGNGPWDGLGYRLLNGTILALALTDLTSRLLNRRWSWGTFVLLIGLSASLIPLIGMADGLLTSPTADTSVLILTIISCSYLADSLDDQRHRSLNLPVAVIVAGLLVMLRPTMVFFTVTTLIIAAVLLWRRTPAASTPHLTWILTLGALASMAVTTLLRDRLLSGWLFYPLSLAPLPVPWLADDPTGPREATLAAARDPNAADGWLTANSWEWLGPWVTRLPSQWETWFVLVGLCITLITSLIAFSRGARLQSAGKLATALAPSAIAVVAWFVLSPPSFRFIWGPLFSLMFLVIGCALLALAQAQLPWPRPWGTTPVALLGCALCVALVAGYSAVMRNQVATINQEHHWLIGPLRIPYAVTPIKSQPVVPVEMSTGLVLTTPVEGDQCWDNYPLCSFSMGNDIGLLGDSIESGFVRR